MKFPKDFLFGTANADHQVEAHDPQREDVWDLWERCQGLTPRGRATDFANRYEEDIASAAKLGCKLFRFSIAWARVEPEYGKFDPEAIRHYEAIADCIRKNGMKVMVTLHHFVWPVWLERDHGGMIGPEFPDIFARYAETMHKAFGEKVDWWITFNEPSQLTFGYIRPWWQNRYYMPPGLPRGSPVDAEAGAVGKLVPNLFLAHARARKRIKSLRPGAQVGVNPLVTGFPTWLQMIMDWGACHRGFAEALFKFTTKNPLVSERGDVDLVIGGITMEDQTKFESSDPYLRTGKAIIVSSGFEGSDISALAGKKIGVIAIGNQPQNWAQDLPKGSRRQLFSNYDNAREALEKGSIQAIYGDAFFLLPQETENRESFRFLETGLSDEHYVVLAPHGHTRLLERVDRAITHFRAELADYCDVSWISEPRETISQAPPPISLHEVFENGGTLPETLTSSRSLRRIERRGKIRIGIRTDAPGISPKCTAEGLEMRLAKLIAKEVFGDETKLRIVPIDPSNRFSKLESKTSWLNWAWRFWGTTSLIANVNWWYLGMAGKLAPELCPEEAIGAQDFIGLDYYWGLPTRSLHKFRLLEDAAHGRFLKAPVWPRGLYHSLRRFSRWFPGQELFIVENGCTPSAGDGISRASYMTSHLEQVSKAIEKGVPVRAYNWWSVTSNREWGHPFDPNTDFGLNFVDLDNDPELIRQPTPEADLFQSIIAKHRKDSHP
ncbi:family 1 glycosylhydrolase [Luteolibacter sp. AS25]|uniref:family 1 glycosylhydrolase n=1 Tax=Luteolibacter sp. AS25 TaxID=3135776 RepID=UPI00398BB84F